jgi:hypothetical protein
VQTFSTLYTLFHGLISSNFLKGYQDIQLDLKAENQSIQLKEGTSYTLHLAFYVQHDIVMGLKYVNTVTRKGFQG